MRSVRTAPLEPCGRRSRWGAGAGQSAGRGCPGGEPSPTTACIRSLVHPSHGALRLLAQAKGSIRGDQHQVARMSLTLAHAQRPLFLIGQQRSRASSRWTWVNSTRTSCFVENCDASAELVDLFDGASRPSASSWNPLFTMHRVHRMIQ